LKAAKMRGELLDAGEVERTWGGILRTVRAGLLAIPSRCGARIPHLSAADVLEIDHRSARRSQSFEGDPRYLPFCRVHKHFCVMGFATISKTISLLVLAGTLGAVVLGRFVMVVAVMPCDLIRG
jgi:hypothetical protein